MKSPYLAMFLSLLLPGLGQFYNGQIPKGLTLIMILMAINILASDPLKIIMGNGSPNLELVDRNTLILLGAYSIAGLSLTIIAAWDAKLTAEKINEEIKK